MVRSKKVVYLHNPDSVSMEYLALIAPFGCPDNTSDTVADGLDDQLSSTSGPRPRRVKRRPNIIFCAGAHNPRKCLPCDFSLCVSRPLRVKKQAVKEPCKFRKVAALRKMYKSHQLAALRVRYRPNQLAALREIRRYHKATKFLIHEPT